MTFMRLEISDHASRRMRQRGVNMAFLERLLACADIERPANDNCRLYRVSRKLAQSLGDERLARFAVVYSDQTGKYVTVAPIHSGRKGVIYRRRERSRH
ncbi:MAG: hypothetical protein QM698_12625 [Micropepsaceae bacterium]